MSNDIKILRYTEFHARAILKPDFNMKRKGFNFSYPIMNTIEIGNILLEGGQICIEIERKGIERWNYNEKLTLLTIETRSRKQEYFIYEPEKLYEAMSDFYDAHIEELTNRQYQTALKKSRSQQGNQNAKKHSATDDDKDIQQENQQTGEKATFCQLDEYQRKYPTKTITDYYNWVVENLYVWKTNIATRKVLEDNGYNMDKAEFEERVKAEGGWSPYTYEQKMGLE